MNQLLKSTGARRFGLTLAAAAALAFTQGASAGVVSGDTYTFSITAFNYAGTAGYVLGNGYSAVFGETTTFASAGYNGQDYTISSYEVVGATTTTDYFKITTPVNFLTTTTVNGTLMSQIAFNIGNANSGVGVLTGADPINFTSAIPSYTATGSMIYGTANTVLTLTPTVTLDNGVLTFTAAEGVRYGTGSSAISSLGVHEFNFSITYANPVPEADTWAMLAAGLGVMGFAVRRNRKTKQA